MFKKVLSTALACTLVLSVSFLAGCSSSSPNTASKKTASASTVELSSTSYEFEKEYAYGDFNAHSNKDTSRQDGIDTFGTKDIVFHDITYDQLMELMDKPGNFMIQLSGSWCHNSRAMSPTVNEYAKKYGIDTIYSYDFNLDNGDDGTFFVRMSNEKTTTGTKYNYMYGEMVSRYLANLDDWVEYPSTDSTALTYTNAQGQETTVGRLQQPIVMVYNKDNTTDYSGKGNTSGKCPIMYALEEMVDRDSNGVYKKKTDDDGNAVLDENGKQVREYCTEEYDSHVKKMFDFIKDNNIEFTKYTKQDHVRSSFNSYGGQIFSPDEQINIYPVTYRQLTWLMKQEGNFICMIGGAGDSNTRAVIKRVNDTAVKDNVRVYLYDPEVDGNQTIKWGYTQSTNILDTASIVSVMYTSLLENGLTNLDVTHKTDDGQPLVQEPYLFAYNKDALDKDGFAGPVKTGSELTYNNDSSSRYYIGKESNQKACDKKISAVISSYKGESSSSK